MTRTERLRLDGKTDTMEFGTLKILERDYVLSNSSLVYMGTDYDYNVDIYGNPCISYYVAVEL